MDACVCVRASLSVSVQSTQLALMGAYLLTHSSAFASHRAAAEKNTTTTKHAYSDVWKEGSIFRQNQIEKARLQFLQIISIYSAWHWSVHTWVCVPDSSTIFDILMSRRRQLLKLNLLVEQNFQDPSTCINSNVVMMILFDSKNIRFGVRNVMRHSMNRRKHVESEGDKITSIQSSYSSKNTMDVERMKIFRLP